MISCIYLVVIRDTSTDQTGARLNHQPSFFFIAPWQKKNVMMKIRFKRNQSKCRWCRSSVNTDLYAFKSYGNEAYRSPLLLCCCFVVFLNILLLGETQGRNTNAVSPFLQRVAGLEGRWRELRLSL